MRISKLLVLVLFLAALIVAACGGSDEPTATPAPPAAAPAAGGDTKAAAPAAQAHKGDATKGQETFLTTCVACHGPEGKGVKGLGKDMTISKFIASKSDDELLAFVKTGRPINDPLNTTGVLMPPKGGNPALTDEELLNIIAFIRTINKP
ncbi:MAG: cytochrome c [Caldilineaceae bacterium]